MKVVLTNIPTESKSSRIHQENQQQERKGPGNGSKTAGISKSRSVVLIKCPISKESLHAIKQKSAHLPQSLCSQLWAGPCPGQTLPKVSIFADPHQCKDRCSGLTSRPAGSALTIKLPLVDVSPLQTRSRKNYSFKSSVLLISGCPVLPAATGLAEFNIRSGVWS